MGSQTREKRDSLSPADAVQRLREGNERFCADLRINRDLLRQVNETRDGQWPFAAVLGCMDSRMSAELIFDQGLGDIFNVRIAGNVVNGDILGSLEFACRLAGARLIVVLGHSRCGAIKSACDGVEFGHLAGLLTRIRPAVDAVLDSSQVILRTASDSDFVEAVAQANVRRSVARIIERSTVLREMKETGAIDIVGGICDVASGTVEFLPDPQ